VDGQGTRLREGEVGGEWRVVDGGGRDRRDCRPVNRQSSTSWRDGRQRCLCIGEM